MTIAGMDCPQCRAPDTQVVDSRSVGTMRQRRRLCGACGYRFGTDELPRTELRIMRARAEAVGSVLETLLAVLHEGPAPTEPAALDVVLPP